MMLLMAMASCIFVACDDDDDDDLRETYQFRVTKVSYAGFSSYEEREFLEEMNDELADITFTCTRQEAIEAFNEWVDECVESFKDGISGISSKLTMTLELQTISGNTVKSQKITISPASGGNNDDVYDSVLSGTKWAGTVDGGYMVLDFKRNGTFTESWNGEGGDEVYKYEVSGNYLITEEGCLINNCFGDRVEFSISGGILTIGFKYENWKLTKKL